jgi:hypothetical protein
VKLEVRQKRTVCGYKKGLVNRKVKGEREEGKND